MKKLLENKKIHILLMVVKAITTLFACIIVSIIFVQRVSNNKITLGGYSIYTIITESMKPKYNIGDMLITKKINPQKINVRDDIVYMGQEGDFKDKIITHQVIGIKKKGTDLIFVTKGIANSIEDPEIKSSQIYGKVVYKTIILSALSKIVNNTYGFYFIIFIPFAIMIFLEILEVIKEKDDLNKIGENNETKEK